MINISERLKELRKTKGYTQKDISLLLGIGERTYRRYELGEVEPTLTNVTKLADYFQVSIDYLLSRTSKLNID